MHDVSLTRKGQQYESLAKDKLYFAQIKHGIGVKCIVFYQLFLVSPGVRHGRQRSPNIAVEVEILNISPKNANKLVCNFLNST